MAIIFIGLGSNDGDSFQILSDAYIDLKKNVGYLMESSSIYELSLKRLQVQWNQVGRLVMES